MIAFLNCVDGESDNLLYGPNERTITVEYEREFIDKRLDSQREVMFTGWIGNNLVSSANFVAHPQTRVAHTSEIGISVRRDFWRLGIGSAMMREILDHARMVGIEVIGLTVFADNAAGIALYHKFGFEEIGRYRNYLKIDGQYRDALYMNCYL